MNLTQTLLDHPEVADIDRHFAAFVRRFGETELPAAAAAMVSRNIRHGHICLDIAAGPAHFDEPPAQFNWPALEIWRKELAANRAIGGPDEGKPLVFDKAGRLYLRRYWEYETSLAEQILERCVAEQAAPSGLKGDQDAAIEMACTRRFTVISGGPGTGKTTTIVKVLNRLFSSPGGEKLRVALAAPTGKAAARLQEVVRGVKRKELAASTLHRLLGSRTGSVSFRHDARNPLPFDLLVVDEASMVSLTLMAKTFAALPAGARVILLGDCDQLSSVEPGAVLGNIADAASRRGGPVEGCLIVLQHNYRFGAGSNIARLCSAVRTGNVDQALEILGGGKHEDLRSRILPASSGLPDALKERVVAGFSPYLAESNPAEALKKFRAFRILCALRSGPFGVEKLNRLIEQILREAGLLSGPPGACPGLPLLIARNDYDLQLFNGDIGILHKAEDGSLVACFFAEDGGLRKIPPSRLPGHEPAFAMTVHKSQGSEFDDVLLLLSDRDSPVLTRELVYTGLTRARRSVELWHQETVLRSSIARKSLRASGLRERLEKGLEGVVSGSPEPGPARDTRRRNARGRQLPR